MTNKDFRRRAWELCRENFGLLLSATFVASLISSLGMSLTTSMEGSLISSMIGIVFSILSALISVGMIRFILDIWHGEKPALSVLFSQKHRLGTYICFTILMALICVGIVIGLMMTGMILYSNTAMIVGMLIAVALMLYLVLRFEMTTTCIVLCPTFRTTECMRTAWRASKGNVWRLLCNAFILGLPLFVAQGLLIGYQTYLSLTGQMLNTVGSLLLDLGSVLISALLSGYIYLGSFSLHEHLLGQYFAAQPGPWSAPASTEEPILLDEEKE